VPELPEIEAYLAALRARILNQPLQGVRLGSAFLLRSVEPPLGEVEGRNVVGLERLGKRIVFAFEGELFGVLHLMVTGRLRWRKLGAGLPGKAGLAAFDFPAGSLVLTEAGSRKRASLHVVAGRPALAEHDPGGVEPLACDLAEFREGMTRRKHTLKRALTSPALVSGIGNWASDEILWEARMSPFKRVADLSDAEWQALFDATRAVLELWRERYVAAALEHFPDKVSAFHPLMAVHGRYRQPCPRCEAPVQRIAFATKHESNYCARCQTGGRLLADRALSKLLRDDWPKTLEELE
jgi:formamidopyrimidine-DNA glycosylase